MLEKNKVNKKVVLRRNHLPAKGLKGRVTYFVIGTFLLAEITLIPSTLWLGQYYFALVVFVFLAHIAETIVADLFGQKKTSVMLYEIIRDILRKLLGK